MSGIVEHIREIAGANRTATTTVFDAKVISIADNNRSCTVERIGGNTSGRLTARLMASVDDGALIIPAVDSTVIVCMSEFVEPYVTMFSEVDSIVWLGGEYDGVPIVKHPTNANKGLLKRLNNLEDKIRDLQNVISTWTPVANDGGAALKVAAASWYGTPITNTAQSDIEHPKITH